MTKGTFSFYGHLKVAIWIKLWSPCSEIMEFLISSYRIVQQSSVKFCTLLKMTLGTFLLCPPPWGVDILFLLFSPSDVRCPLSDVRCPMSGVRRPMSGVTHGFRSFKGKVLELLSPNLVCRLIGSVACLGLLLAVVPLLLTE